jgi:hypothetical protein
VISQHYDSRRADDFGFCGRESSSLAVMKNGIFRDEEGYDILHNGVHRTFRDVQATAFEAARYAKSRNPKDIIEIRDRSSGEKLIMLEDGRTG